MAHAKVLPEFKALETVLYALAPLKPEGRRKVIEAVHSLIEISTGTRGQDGQHSSPSAIEARPKKPRR
jgi:hypothetical protein